ncbi:MAG: inositol monophosphatase [Planctomycetia bacterium]|nr:inositol monophosphatase [Planctomycetia bacterium]
MRDTDLTARLELARAAARQAGALTLRYFHGSFDVEWKADASPVTVADREAEKLLRQRIGESFPADAILGEELGDKAGSSGYRWILDPIDGTKSFVRRVPLYGTLIGVEFEGRSVVGVISAPATGEMVYAAAGRKAWYQKGDSPPCPAVVSSTARIADALFLTSEIEGYNQVGRPDVVMKLAQAARITRTWGDAYGYLLVATGRADFMVDPRMNLWDAAALLPVLQEAGGTFTDWNGAPRIDGGNGVATNGKLLREVLSFTRSQ